MLIVRWCLVYQILVLTQSWIKLTMKDFSEHTFKMRVLKNAGFIENKLNNKGNYTEETKWIFNITKDMDIDFLV